MRYYKMISDGYFLSVGVGLAGEEITEAEYNSVMETIRNAPVAPDGYGYRLTDSLEWELHEMPAEDITNDEDEIAQKAAAYDILIGGASV